jgi:hypothetical protein
MKTLFEKGDRVRIKKTGEITTVEAHVENMHPPVVLANGQIEFTDDLEFIPEGQVGASGRQ